MTSRHLPSLSGYGSWAWAPVQLLRVEVSRVVEFSITWHQRAGYVTTGTLQLVLDKHLEFVNFLSLSTTILWTNVLKHSFRPGGAYESRILYWVLLAIVQRCYCYVEWYTVVNCRFLYKLYLYLFTFVFQCIWFIAPKNKLLSSFWSYSMDKAFILNF